MALSPPTPARMALLPPSTRPPLLLPTHRHALPCTYPPSHLPTLPPSPSLYLPTPQILDDESWLVVESSDVEDSDADTEDSNAEGYYAHDYPG